MAAKTEKAAEVPVTKEPVTYDFVDCVEVAPAEKRVNKPRDKTATDLAITQMRKAIGRSNQHGSDSMDRLARDAKRWGKGLTISHLVVDRDGVVWDHSVHDNVTVVLT